MSESSKKQSRRKFIDKSLVTGVALSAIGMSIMKLNKDPDDNEVVKMITSDGKLVEVNKKHIFKMCAGRVSNARLKNWIDKEKNQQGLL